MEVTPTVTAAACPSTAVPPARTEAAMAYLPTVGQAVLFGGSAKDLLGDTWTWRSGCWSEVASIQAPSPRMDMAMTYDPVRKIAIAYGGRISARALLFSRQTWAWNGRLWSLLDANGPDLGFAWAAFDPTQERVVLYGSSVAGIPSTWAWGGAAWTRVGLESPPDRQGASMATDPITGQPILFGGVRLSQVAYLNDTWTWNGVAWVQLTPLHSPPGRIRTTMVTSVSHKILLAIGGEAGGVGLFSDAWAWDGSDWTQVTGIGEHAGATGVDVGDRILIFGGVGPAAVTNQAYAWDGSKWSAA